ncbi:MAG: hypothetical protein ACREEQ_08420, partial [Caulobacteraceae bacterium]
DKVYDLEQKFQDLRTGGASITDAAAKLGLTAVTVGPVTADGKEISSPAPNPALDQKVLATAFQLPKGGDSDVEPDTGSGEYYAVHVDKVIPPSPPSLDEKGVRATLTQAYYEQNLVGALQAKANAAEAALRKGQTFEAVASGYGAHVTHQLGLQEVSAQAYQKTLGQSFLGAIFEAKKGDIFSVGSDPLQGYVVARLDALHAADPKQTAQVVDALSAHVTEGYLNSLQTAVSTASVALIKPKTNLALARSVMGVDAAMLAKAGVSDAKGGTAKGAAPKPASGPAS